MLALAPERRRRVLPGVLEAATLLARGSLLQAQHRADRRTVADLRLQRAHRGVRLARMLVVQIARRPPLVGVERAACLRA